MKARSIVFSVVASAIVSCIGIAPVHAQHANTPGIDNAQQQIRMRIQQGIASGHITPHEAEELHARERNLQYREMQMKRDGNATPQERRQLREELDNMHAEVEHKLANRQVTAHPQSGTQGVDRAQYDIRARIQHGIRTGHLTQRESHALFARERQLHRLEAAFKSDGIVTRMERRQLREEVAMLSEEVDRMMTNRRHY
jgi:FtsZ-binding cell division protein ZapB